MLFNNTLEWVTYLSTQPELAKADVYFVDSESEGLHFNTSFVQLSTTFIDYVMIIKINNDEDLSLLTQFLNTKKLIGYNLAYDLPMLNVKPVDMHDLFYLTKIAYPELQEFNLTNVSNKLLQMKYYQGIETIKKVTTSFKRNLTEVTPQQLTYMEDDVKVLKELWALERIQLAKKNVSYLQGIQTLKDLLVWQENETPILQDKVIEKLEKLNTKIVELQKTLLDLTQIELNPRSSKQIKEYFNIGSSDEATLKRIHLLHNKPDGTLATVLEQSVAGLLLTLRKTLNIKSKLVRFDVKFLKGRFNPMGTATSRWNCAGTSGSGIKHNPNLVNLQNYPRDFKDLIGVPEDSGYVIVQADYATLELRISACIMKEDNLYKALMRGEDPHTTTASFINKVP